MIVMSKIKVAMAVAVMSAAIPLSISAQPNSAEQIYNLSLAATCANCHGTNGISVAGNNMPQISDLTHEEIKTRMLEYKAGTRQGTIMPQLAKGFTDEQINAIAMLLGKKN